MTTFPTRPIGFVLGSVGLMASVALAAAPSGRTNRQTGPGDVVKEPTTMPAKKTAPDAPASPLDFTVQTIDGKEQKLSDYRGKVVVLDFWGDW